MFDSFYDFKYKNFEKGGDDELYLRVYNFTFLTSDNQRYVVRVEEYAYSVFIIKFYPKDFQDSPDKFKILTGKGKPQPILRTCINILIEHFLKIEPKASFGFLASELTDENTANTKRYRVYKNLMEFFFSPLNFTHYRYPDYSIYLLLNKANSEENLLQKLEQMFWKYYDFGEKEINDS